MSEVSGPPIIDVRGLRKTYGEVVALAGVDFQVSPGCIMGLVGPNGAGKTTIIRAACGIHPASGGSVCIAGHDVVDAPIEAKRRLAYVPDDPQLFATLTVWEHLRFTASAYDVESALAGEGERLLEQFDLSEKRDTPAQELSRGMRQKVAICCAYLHRPAAMFLDEPLNGLDPRGIRTMKDSIRGAADAGAAVVISSHLLSLVENMCTDLLVLHRGRRLYFGPLERLRDEVGAVGTEESLEDIFLRMTDVSDAREDAATAPSAAMEATDA